MRFYDLSEMQQVWAEPENQEAKQEVIDSIVKSKGNQEKKEKKAKNVDFFQDL